MLDVKNAAVFFISVSALYTKITCSNSLNFIRESDDDQIRVETCTDPCGLNRSDVAASTASDDDQINAIRTSQNEKETLFEETKGLFQDLKGHFVT